MKLFVCLCALVAVTMAGESEKRDKRGLFGLGYGGLSSSYSVIGLSSGIGLISGIGFGYSAPAVSYSAPVVAAAPRLVAINRVVSSVPQVINVRKVVSVPQVVTEKRIVSAPSVAFGISYGSLGGISRIGYGSVYGYGVSSYGSGWW